MLDPNIDVRLGAVPEQSVKYDARKGTSLPILTAGLSEAVRKHVDYARRVRKIVPSGVGQIPNDQRGI
jgi:hypothetical protein